MTEINTHNLIVSFGKHKSERWTRIPVGYLKWLINENTQYSDIAKAELERRGTTLDVSVEISGHAIDKASLRCRKIWHETALNDDEGLHAWLHRIATEALDKAHEEGTELTNKTKVEYLGMKLAFKFGEIYPTLLTIMPKRRRHHASNKNQN
jgi:hypothetical protein